MIGSGKRRFDNVQVREGAAESLQGVLNEVACQFHVLGVGRNRQRAESIDGREGAGRWGFGSTAFVMDT